MTKAGPSPGPAVEQARHAALQGYGPAGVRAVAAARVLIVGLGGLGSPAARYLAAAGIGHLSLCDYGSVDAPDLQRQILYGAPDIGRAKAALAAPRLQGAHPGLSIDVLDRPFDADMVAGHDVVLDGTDEPGTRALVHAVCRRLGVPLVWGALEGWDGQLTTIVPEGPCLDCLMPIAQDAPACADIGVFGPLAGTIGVMMAGEALKQVIGAPVLSGRLLMVDARDGDMQTIAYAQHPDCPTCAEGAK